MMRTGLSLRHAVIGGVLAVVGVWSVLPASEASVQRHRVKAERERSAALQDLMTDEEQRAWRLYKTGQSTPRLPASATANEDYQRAYRAYR